MTGTPDPIAEAIFALQRAFPARPLDPASALAESGATWPDAADFIAHAAGKTWPDLDPQRLESDREALFFVAPSAFPDYLPAFLVAALGHFAALDLLPDFVAGALTRPADPPEDQRRFDERTAGLTTAQRDAVTRALAALERLDPRSGDENPATVALDSHWRPRRADGN